MRRLLVLLAVAACRQPRAPEAVIPMTSAVDVARGAYVAAVSGCFVCHVRGGAQLHAPNITPDRATGIGRWSDAQIIAAIRRGIRPDGRHLAPTMPYPYFHAMTDSDATAIVAYLRMIPARSERIPPAALRPRPIALPPPANNVDPVGNDRKHGQYLATLMQCAACHGASYAGGKRFGRVVAPNITPDTVSGIGTWTNADIIRAIRQMKDPAGVPLRSPMADYRGSWSQLTEADAYAVATYLQSVPAVRTGPHPAHEHPKVLSRRP